MGAEVPTRRVESIEFGILSPEDIVSMSVCKIKHPETLENGVPKEEGLLDLRLGTCERGFLCSTCGHRSDMCVGHFGYIELTKPVFHIGFLGKIKKVLESVCFFCSKIRIDKSVLGSVKPRNQRERKRRLNQIWNMSKNRTVCVGETVYGEGREEKHRTGCENKQPVIRKEGMHLLAFQKGEDAGEGKTVISAEKALEILRRISDEDILALGFDLEKSRPEWMVIQMLPVPPPQVRPSIVMEGSLRCEDDLTHKLSDIIKASTNLKRYEQEGAPGHIIRDYEQLLQFHVATLINNDISGQPQSLQKNGRPLKSLRARIRGKEGRVRGNLMGKRVDFSARTVITADPNISMNEVGVPEKVAQVLTFPERVTEYNIEEAREAVHRGPYNHPGANYVVRDDGQRIDLRFFKGEMNVQIGYTVERHLRNGDIVLFNRQPSLHKMSMMAHRARIMKYSTFRLNLSVTSPYNADFDGDEMNLHLPQSIPAQTELRELALVEKNIVSPQSNRPVMGIVQDTLLGVYKLTRKDVFLTRGQMMQLVYAIDNGKEMPKPAVLRPAVRYTGKQVFSYTLPQVSYSGFHSGHAHDLKQSPNASDSVVVIREGELLSGVVCKKTVGTASGGLIHVVANDFPRSVCVAFMDSLQRGVASWLESSESFSVGIGDAVIEPSAMDAVKEAIEKAKAEVNRTIAKTERGELERLPGMTVRESFETAATLALNKARDTSGTSIQKDAKSMNNVKHMVLSGSKGSFINISQISSCVGQQNVEGKRILEGFRNRALPHFAKDDYGAESRGFVSNSYIAGLTPTEFFFHAMGGREGLIDTAVKTAETGYIQRRLVKALEDAQVRHDKSVRDGEGHVLQFAYGGDCLDGTYLEMQSLALICTDAQFISKYMVDLAGISEYPITQKVQGCFRQQRTRNIVAEELKMLREEREMVRRSFTGNKKALSVPIERVLQNAQRMSQSPVSVPGVVFGGGAGIRTPGRGDVDPEEIVQAREALENSLLPFISPIKEVSESAFVLFRAHLRGYLTIKRVLCEYTLSTSAFRWAVEAIKTSFLRSIISPGEMVGTLAAQCIGEPATQMTLNTFHLAGVASTVTRGVPRLKEIINVARTIKTPSLTVHLVDELKYSVEGAKRVQQEIERCYVRDVLIKSEVVYDPVSRAVKEDADFIEAYAVLDPSIYSPGSPWVLRLVLDRNELLDRGLRIERVAEKIEKECGCRTIYSDENAAALIIRCILPDSEERLKRAEAVVTSVMLKGLPKIKKVFINEVTTNEKTEYILQTEGTGLRDLFAHPMVDRGRTVSNDPLEMFEVLGIEAARSSVLNEIRGVIESDGSYVNYRHLFILADIMTQRGTLQGVTRHGTNRGESGVLMRCSFEETVEILLEAAMSAEVDPCKGVVESIMLGKTAMIGTGITESLIDKENLELGIMAMEKYDFEDEGSGDRTPSGIDSPFTAGISEYSGYSPGHASSQPWSPLVESGYSPEPAGEFVGYSPRSPGRAYFAPASPTFMPGSPSFSPKSPAGPQVPYLYTPSSPQPNYIAPYSPAGAMNMISSPTSQTMYTPAVPYSREKRRWSKDEESSEEKEKESRYGR